MQRTGERGQGLGRKDGDSRCEVQQEARLPVAGPIPVPAVLVERQEDERPARQEGGSGGMDGLAFARPEGAEHDQGQACHCQEQDGQCEEVLQAHGLPSQPFG